MVDAAQNFNEPDSDGEGGALDPFSLVHTIHPAIGESHDLSDDIYEDLFNEVFERRVFRRWIYHQHSWQIHCVGSPGAGKTTFASLTAKHVRKNDEGAPKFIAHVASIFIQEVAIENELLFLEDFLHSTYAQLTRSALPTSHAVSKLYDKYARACDEGRRAPARIELIRLALQQRLDDVQSPEVAFLLVDNIDHCSGSLQELLQREISVLQAKRLRILITSRMFRDSRTKEFWCDFHEEQYAPMEVYWRCIKCENCDICVDCYKEDMKCKTCGVRTIWREPDHLNLHLDSISRSSISDFIAWDLEREHGDLGLGSLHPRKPPLSQFGIAFKKTKSGATGQDWLQRVAAMCMGSVVDAKLALDRLHDLSSPEQYDFEPRRIPTNVQIQFSNAIASILRQPISQRNLALKALAAVGYLGDGTDGIPISALADLLKERTYKRKTSIRPRSVEDVLDACHGYLRLMPSRSGDDEYTIAAYSTRFYIYIMDEYHDEIRMANALLPNSNPKRFATYALSKEESLEEFLEKRMGARSAKIPVLPGQQSPLGRRGSFDFARSHTYMSPIAPKITSPPLGLGLMFEPSSYVSERKS